MNHSYDEDYCDERWLERDVRRIEMGFHVLGKKRPAVPRSRVDTRKRKAKRTARKRR